MQALREVRFEATESDLVAVMARSLRTSSLLEQTYRKNWRNGIVAAVFMTGVFAGPLYAMAPTPSRGAVRVGVFLVLWLAVMPFYARRHLTRAAFNRKLDELAARSVKERMASSGPPGAVEVLLHSEQIEIIDNDQLLARPWSSVARVDDEPGALFVEFKDKMLVRVPDRAFVTAAEREAFLEEATRLMRTGAGGRPV